MSKYKRLCPYCKKQKTFSWKKSAKGYIKNAMCSECFKNKKPYIIVSSSLTEAVEIGLKRCK